MINLTWYSKKECVEWEEKGKITINKTREIDKSVYFELLRRGKGKPLSLPHIHRGSNKFLKSRGNDCELLKSFDTSLEDTKASLKRLEKSGDAVYVHNNKWQLRMEFTLEEKRKAKKLSKELSVPLPEPELIKMAKKSGFPISDLLNYFSGCIPGFRNKGIYIREVEEYLENPCLASA